MRDYRTFIGMFLAKVNADSALSRYSSFRKCGGKNVDNFSKDTEEDNSKPIVEQVLLMFWMLCQYIVVILKNLG